MYVDSVSELSSELEELRGDKTTAEMRLGSDRELLARSQVGGVQTTCGQSYVYFVGGAAQSNGGWERGGLPGVMDCGITCACGWMV